MNAVTVTQNQAPYDSGYPGRDAETRKVLRGKLRRYFK